MRFNTSYWMSDASASDRASYANVMIAIDIILLLPPTVFLDFLLAILWKYDLRLKPNHCKIDQGFKICLSMYPDDDDDVDDDDDSSCLCHRDELYQWQESRSLVLKFKAIPTYLATCPATSMHMYVKIKLVQTVREVALGPYSTTLQLSDVSWGCKYL